MLNHQNCERISPATPTTVECRASEASATSSHRTAKHCAPTPPHCERAVSPTRGERFPSAGPKAHDTEMCFAPEASPTLCRLVDEYVLPCLIPTQEAMMQRMANLRYLANVLTDTISCVAWRKGVQYGDIRYYLFGSVRMRTVLPDGDNDVTIEVDGLTNPTRIVGPTPPFPACGDTAVESLECNGGAGSGSGSGNGNGNGSGSGSGTGGGAAVAVRGESPTQAAAQAAQAAAAVAGGDLLTRVADYLRQHNTTVHVDALVPAEVRVLKLVLAGSTYDVTVGQHGGVDCVRFLHEMDTMIGKQHLVKRTLLLLRAWCCYEAHILGGQGGYISSYAATVMLFAILNTVEFLEDAEDTVSGGREVTPLQLFARFLTFYSYFDFDRYCVTVFGPLPCTSINGTALDLTRLEVPAAHTHPNCCTCGSDTDKPHNDNNNDGGDGGDGGDDGGLSPVDTNELGLTAEGKAALGHLVRRRAKPFLTVSGVRRFLHTVRRQRERERRVRMGEESPTESPPDDAVCLERPGCASEDTDLDCPMCVTNNFPVRTMNVMDPLRWSSNTCRGVCRNHLQRIHRAFLEGLALLRDASARVQDPLSAPGSATSSSCGCGGCGAESSASSGRGATKEVSAVLQSLFGQAMKAAGAQQPMQPQPQSTVGLAKCGQCTRPSVFCVLDPRHVCGAQFVFDRKDVIPAAQQQHQQQQQQHQQQQHQQHQQQQQQQHQQQMNMLAAQAAAVSTTAAAAVPSLADMSGGRCRCSPSTPCGNNSNGNIHKSSIASTPTAVNSMAGGSINGGADAASGRHLYARGPPLMRANGTAIMQKGGHVARGGSGGGSGGGGGGGGYAEYGAACYAGDPASFPFFPGCPTVPIAGHAKRGGQAGASVGFAMPPQPLPLPSAVLTPKHAVRGYGVMAPPQQAQAQGPARIGGSQGVSAHPAMMYPFGN